MFKIKQSFSTAYHPQAQGEVERCNRTLVTALRNFVNSKQTDWDTYVPSLVWALNTSENQPLGYSSFMLVFGRTPTHPAEMDLPETLDMNQTVQDHLSDILRTQAACSNFAEERLKEQQLKMKERYDLNATPITISPGDTVYVYQPKIRVRKTKRKLQANYHGPYIVVDYNTPTTVMLRRLSDGKNLTKAVNIMRLKKGHVRAKVNAWDPLPDEGDSVLSEDDLPDTSFGSDSDEDLTDIPKRCPGLRPRVLVSDHHAADPQPSTSETIPARPVPKPRTKVTLTTSPSAARPVPSPRTDTPGPAKPASRPVPRPRTSLAKASQVLPPTPEPPSDPPSHTVIRRDGTVSEIVKTHDVKTDRQTGLLKYQCEFHDGQFEWVLECNFTTI